MKLCVATQTGVASFIFACFGDPGMSAQVTFIAVSMIATLFSVVTSLQRTIIQAEHLLKLYGYDAVCSGVSVGDLPVLASDNDFAFDAIVARAEAALHTQGAGVVVLGCGDMSHLRADIEPKVGIPTVDCATAAAKLLEATADLGLKTSQNGDLAFPIPKPYLGESARFGNGG